MNRPLPILHGRGASANPTNRFERLHVEEDFEHFEGDAEFAESMKDRRVPTHYFLDTSRTAIAYNDSPDIPFSASLNPYRGCSHGCIYCYARPGHEYLGFSAGLDFESKIMVKADAPQLLRRELAARAWRPQTVAIGGVTDPYQPVERKLELTRRCLQVFAGFRNPVGIVTKNHLVTRDIDILAELASHRCAMVYVSITTLRPDLTRIMEPRTSVPKRRLEAIRRLRDAGVPAGVMVAPIIPGLTESEVPAILTAAAEAGAMCAGYVALRLPHGVAGLFEQWLTQHFPDRREKVLNRVRSMRGGKLYDAQFGQRMRGTGIYADQIRDLFELGARRAALPRRGPELSTDAFRDPGDGQMMLW